MLKVNISANLHKIWVPIRGSEECIKDNQGVSWWCSRLRIWHCHSCGVGLIPGLGTSARLRHGQKIKMKKKKKVSRSSLVVQWVKDLVLSLL